MPSLDLDTDPVPFPIARGVWIGIRHDVLVAEVLENLVKEPVQAAHVLGEERAPTADRREAVEDSLKIVCTDCASLPDHVDGRITSLRSSHGGIKRRVARLVVAITEEHHRSTSGLTSQTIQRIKDNVVERGPAPSAHAIDCPRASGLVSAARRERVNNIVEREQGDVIRRSKPAEKALGRFLDPRKRVPHARTDIKGRDHLKGDVL